MCQHLLHGLGNVPEHACTCACMHVLTTCTAVCACAGTCCVACEPCQTGSDVYHMMLIIVCTGRVIGNWSIFRMTVQVLSHNWYNAAVVILAPIFCCVYNLCICYSSLYCCNVDCIFPSLSLSLPSLSLQEGFRDVIDTLLRRQRRLQSQHQAQADDRSSNNDSPSFWQNALAMTTVAAGAAVLIGLRQAFS